MFLQTHHVIGAIFKFGHHVVQVGNLGNLTHEARIGEPIREFVQVFFGGRTKPFVSFVSFIFLSTQHVREILNVPFIVLVIGITVGTKGLLPISLSTVDHPEDDQQNEKGDPKRQTDGHKTFGHILWPGWKNITPLGRIFTVRSLELVLTITARMTLSLRNKVETFTTIDTKGANFVVGTKTVVGTKLVGLKLTILASKTRSVVVGLGTITLKLYLVGFLGSMGVTFGAVHAHVCGTGANVQANVAGETHVSNRTDAVLKILTMRSIFNIELVQVGLILGTLSANSIILAGQVARGVIFLFVFSKFADWAGKTFWAVASQNPVATTTKKRWSVSLDMYEMI